MKISKEISICGHTFRIKYKKGLMYDGQKCWGLCDYDNHVIYLQQAMNSTQKMEIVLHEAIHAMEYIHNFTFSEIQVKILTLGLLGLIRDNKLNFLSK